MTPSSQFSAGRLQQILNSAVDTGIITLDPDGNITSWSKGAEKLLGWSQDEMVGRTLIDIFPAEEGAADILAAELADARRNGKGEVKAGGSGRTGDGSGRLGNRRRSLMRIRN